MNWFEVGMMGMLAGVVGTGAGGLLSILIRKPSARFTGTILAFAAGVMLSIIFIELIDEAIIFSGHWTAIGGLSSGIGIFYLLDHYLPHQHTVTDELIPDAYESAGAHLSILGITSGTILGILFTAWF